MLHGPFSIEVSENAEKVELDLLSETERRFLLEGVAFDEKVHDIFRFFIAPVPRQCSRNASKRQIKRISYEMVDRAYVDVSIESGELSILGMYPRGYEPGKGHDFDFAGQASLALLEAGKMSLKLSGKLRNIFRKSSRECWAFRIDRKAQWIFGEPWIRDGREFRLQLVLVVPKRLQAERRVILCSAKFADSERSLARVNRKPVHLPH